MATTLPDKSSYPVSTALDTGTLARAI
jgi:hypothetical protein